MRRCMGCMKELEDNVIRCPYCGYEKGATVEEPYYLLPETVLHKTYVVGKVLGYGGFGVTYIGWDMVLERVVAIKEYFPSDCATRGYGVTKLTIYSGDASEQFRHGLDSFIGEARDLAALNRVPGIVSVYDCFLENETGYIIMEYLHGENIKEMLAKCQSIPYEKAKEIVLQVLDGLAEVHKEGLVHRDVAPDNIFLTTDGEVKLIDFGAARYALSDRSKSLSVILKPGYAPEEQYRSHGKQGPWTDIYGLGASFYRMITGIRPDESIDRMVGDMLKPPSDLGVMIPESDEKALMKSLAVRKEDRFQNAEEFKQALLTKPKPVETTEMKSSVKNDSNRKMLLGFVAGAATLAVIFGAVEVRGMIRRQNRYSGNNISVLLETEMGTEVQALTEWITEVPTEFTTEAVTEILTEAATERVTETVTETMTETATEEATEAETKTMSEAVTENETETITETITELVTETSTEQLTETGPEAVTEIETETITETITELVTEAPTEAITESETEVLTEFVTEPETEASTESGTETESEPETEPETEVPTEFVTELETETPTEAITELETEVLTEFVTEPETEAMTEPETESETETLPEEVTESETEPETEEPTEPVTESETEPSTETITEAQTEALWTEQIFDSFVGTYTVAQKVPVSAYTVSGDETPSLTLQPNTSVLILETEEREDGTWGKIFYYGYEGWVKLSELTEISADNRIPSLETVRYVNCDSDDVLAVYETANGGGEILAELVYGTEVQIEQYENAWGLITINLSEEDGSVVSIRGWIDMTRTSVLVDGVYYYVHTSSGTGVNLRESPDSSSAQIGSLSQGTTITITECSNGWGKTAVDGIEGWVSLTFMTPCADSNGGDIVKPTETESSSSGSSSSGSSSSGSSSWSSYSNVEWDWG